MPESHRSLIEHHGSVNQRAFEPVLPSANFVRQRSSNPRADAVPAKKPPKSPTPHHGSLSIPLPRTPRPKTQSTTAIPLLHAPWDAPRVASPISKRKHRHVDRRVHAVAIAQVASPENNPSFGPLALDEWLATYEFDVLQYDSIGAFVEIKLKEALVLSSKFATPMNRFRAAVVCSLVERVALALANAESCRRYAPTILRLVDELRSLIFINDDDECETRVSHSGHLPHPRTLSFFLAKAPYFTQLRLEVTKKDAEFRKHQAVLRKLIQSTFQNVGSVFQAWKMHTRTKKEDRLAKKATEITGRVLAKRGQARIAFVSWARYVMAVRLEKMRLKEAHLLREHSQLVLDLRKQLSHAHDTIAVLRAEVHDLQPEALLLEPDATLD
ncbi:hypothetical protein SDRG_05738 [Saprolegnia diclina VS20]|uniref:Uncharacterized protein n=1 Tax=Saprolegnia diclina (strain VS20) TaxID=1156394 RepID=T0QSE3_SAPDV|nr:hypothetical protein SDRG_05738 [Saprolegnia diclina VS20]EQC36910.1 hypothetical protein SDRG_05738 [Saprolegnia diclina VS20]|eukprot:XP_008609691.1 hypothetical protein SDRG_05738 [Saprolegnia diclina VS20]